MEKLLESNKEIIQHKQKEIQILDSEVIDNLETIKELGNGASGTAYEVIRTIIEKQKCVLKVLKNLNHESFQQLFHEYEILNALDHPNVLKTYGIFMSNETKPPSILLEYCSSDIYKEIGKKKSFQN